MPTDDGKRWRRRAEPQDCRLVIRDVARLLLYPLFLLNCLVVGVGLCLCAPCVCAYCRRRQQLWHTTDEYHPHAGDDYVAMEEGAGAGAAEGGSGGNDGEAHQQDQEDQQQPAMSRGLTLESPVPPPPDSPYQQEAQPRARPPAPTPLPAVLRGFGANRPDMRRVRYFNFYLPVADGTRLAVDVWLPDGYASPLFMLLE